MSLVPEFELGLWNAWILILPVIFLQIFGAKILGKRGSGEDWGHTKKEKILNIASSSIVLAPYAYSIFLPLKLGATWFYAGLLVYLLGLFVEVSAMLSFYTTPVGKPVTKGVYSISRHPMYLGHFFINISIGIACLSWIFLLVAILAVIIEYSAVASEERACLKQYGAAYREYMNRTPRWIGIPKSGEKN